MRIYLFCFVFLVWGADGRGQGFRGSIVAGANFSQIDGDDLNGFYQPGLNAGLRVVALLGDHWRIGPELLFSQQGARRNTNSFNISNFDRFRINAVEVPLMVYYKDWRLTAEAGVSYNQVIDFEVLDSGGQDISTTSPLADNVFAVKFGVTFYLSPRWGVNFRWSKHLNNINDFGIRNMRGRTISLRAVYTLGRGEELPGNLSSRDEN